MRTPLSWYNLRHDSLRTLVAILGVAFAVLLIFLQLGSYGAVLETATLIYSRLDYDILLCSKEYLHFSRPGQFAMDRLVQAREVPQVAKVSPFYISYVPWRNPETQQRRAILLMANLLEDPVFLLPEIGQHNDDLKQPGAVLMDRLSRPEFGAQQEGMQTDIGRVTLTVIGFFTMGTGFGADGAIVSSANTLGRILPQRSMDDINLGLIKLVPGADPGKVAAELKARLPADVQVFTRRENESREQRHWTSKTSVGVILGTGLGVALIVGVAIVYQVLASNISAHLAEYATLKAMGYTSGWLSWLVVQQALILAIVGFVPGLIASFWLYDFIRRWAHIPIEMSWPRMALVWVGSLGMCSVAALFSLRKVHSADPAELF